MLISKEYQEQNSKAHSEDTEWGTTAYRFADLVRELSNQIKAESILDYGAGKQTLRGALPGMNIHSYDPCIKEISKSPGRHDLVCCIDVLEHVEPDCLDEVLDDLKRVTKKMGFFLISTVPAKKHLPDGRNAHLIVEDEKFWLPKLLARFGRGMVRNEGNGLVVFVNAEH